MATPAIEPRLARWIETLVESRWAAMVLDAHNRVLWVSDELQSFIGEHDPERLGIGKHIISALLSEAWLRTISPDSALAMVRDAMPFFLDTVPGGAEGLAQTIEPAFRGLLDTISAQPQPDLFTGSFVYVEGDLDPYEVRYIVALLRDESGVPLGSVAFTYMGLRPTLVSLLARGDESMYERMAQLVEPRRRQAAILFSDLQDSGDLSRRLPTPRYFELIRTLSTRFDHSVAANRGVVGKHAGDGMTAFFIAPTDIEAGEAACGALRTARDLQRWADELSDSANGGLPFRVRVNIALHWGANLYMGQLVPGGRLDVTALGDEVNECARMQESTRDGAIAVSKTFAELLPPADAARLGVDLSSVLYEPLAKLPGVSDKAVRDAGTLAVARL